MEQKINEKLEIKDMIYTIRGQQVMFDFDLAESIGYELKQINQQVKRHKDKFAEGDIFQISKEELELVRSLEVTAPTNLMAGNAGGRRTLPYALTMQAIEVLGTILRKNEAQKSIKEILQTFSNESPNSILALSKNTDDIKSFIHVIRGEQVMLNLDLADIYGYDIKSFNRQVMNNIEKFESDFMFELSKVEWDELWRKFYATTLLKKSRTRPYAFTEAGIYMLMTVLKGELATEQSKMLIRTFKQMRHYFAENRQLVDIKAITNLSIEVGRLDKSDSVQNGLLAEHTDRLNKIDLNFNEINLKMEEMMNTFTANTKTKEFVFLDGEKFEATLCFRQIFDLAKTSIILIDEYISVETLNKLDYVKDTVSITVISDNKAHKDKLQLNEFNQFKQKHPNVKLLSSEGKIHDRFIIIDYDTKYEAIYLSGTSSKDAGSKMCMITSLNEITSADLHIQEKLLNPELILP